MPKQHDGILYYDRKELCDIMGVSLESVRHFAYQYGLPEEMFCGKKYAKAEDVKKFLQWRISRGKRRPSRSQEEKPVKDSNS